MITLKISSHCNTRGRGFWKLNTSFLSEAEYINQIKLNIQQTKDEYCNDESVGPHLLWEMIKMKVREESIKFGASKKKKTAKKQEDIEQSIATLEQYLSDENRGGGGKRRGLGPRNDVLTTCKAVNPRASQRPSKAAVCFLIISTLALSVE